MVSCAKNHTIFFENILLSSPNSIRVTSLEQLSVAEFSGELAMPKVYENGLKNFLAIWLDSELKVKNVENQSF